MRVTSRICVCLLAVFFCCRPALSQTVQGVITGTVTDPSGAAVPNATITITNAGTNVSQTTTSGADGTYRFLLVPPGAYTLSAKAANFAEIKASGIVVQASQVIPFNVKLELAKVSATIEVTEQAPLVQTATSDLSTQVNRATVLNTPLADRDVFATLPFLAPQVTPGMDLMPTAGGAREAGTSYLLNGADDNDNFSAGAINTRPPLESVEDFSIMTNNMSAQYGRGAGAVVSVNQTSGTNRFHGALYEFNRNALLNANDFFYDRQLNADPTLSKRPKYIRNQFGGAITGPIRKDKTFFSFAYDRIKLLSGIAQANNFVPTSAAVAFLQANGGPLAQQILSAAPPVTSDLPCPASVAPPGTTGAGTQANGLPNTVGCLSFFNPQSDTENAYYARVDHNFSTSDRLSVSANLTRGFILDKFGGGPLTTAGPINATTTNHFSNYAVNETHLFNPRLINEVTLSHNRNYSVSREGDGKSTLPNALVDNQNEGCLGYTIGGVAQGFQLLSFVTDRWGLTDNLSWTAGRHSFKFGGGTQWGVLYRNWDLGPPGQYQFGELISVNGNCPSCSVITPATDPNGSTQQPDGTIRGVLDPTLSNFAGDYPYFQETSVDPRTGAKANAYRHYTAHDYYWFIQDDWKVTRRLTLNLGLRWDRYGAPSEVNNILAQFTNIGCSLLDPACISGLRVGPVNRMWRTNNKDFGPRIGFAWDVFGNGKMAVRGGFGIFYDRIFDNIWSNGAWNPPFYALLDFNANATDAIFYSNPASIGAAYNPNGPCGQIPYAPCASDPAGKRVSVRTMDQNMRDSSSQNFYFGLDRQLFGGMLLRVNYQGSLGRHLPMLENYNRVDGIAYGRVSPNSLSPLRPNPLYTGFNYRSNSVSSNYNALVVEVQKRMGHGLQFQTGYAFSKLLDVNSELFAGCSTIGGFTAPYYYISNNLQKLSYGRASFDRRQSYKLSVIYDLPFMRAQHGFLGHAFGGWQLGSFLQLYSGHPIDVFNGRTRIRARDSGGVFVRDQNGIPFNIGGDYNLDGVANDKPIFTGSSIGGAYSGASPADGIFTDNNRIGCGGAGIPSNVSPSVSSGLCPATPSSLFINPAYPGGSTPFERFGTLGRNVFQGPKFIQMDLGLTKAFALTETKKLELKVQAQNLANHPNFDCIDSNLSSGTFGQAQCLTPFGVGAPKSRIMSIGLRFAF